MTGSALALALASTTHAAAPVPTLSIETAPWFPPSRSLARALADEPAVALVWSGDQEPGAAVLRVGGEPRWSGVLPPGVEASAIVQALAHRDPAGQLETLVAPRSAPSAADLNAEAWRLLTEHDAPKAWRRGRRLAQRAVSRDPAPAHLDTLARALWQTGRPDRALDVQRRALGDLPPSSPLHAELLATLHEYEAAFALSATPGPPWTGSINAAFETGERRWAGATTARLEQLAAAFGGEVDGERDALPADRLNLLYGSPATHPALARVLDHHGIRLADDGIQLGGLWVPAPQPFLIAALPHPDQPDRPVVVYVAQDPAVASQLNRVFHGPTALVAGPTAGGTPRPTLSAPATLGPDGRLAGPAACLEALSAAAMRAELLALEAQLTAGYAGFEDLELRLDGPDGWAAHRDELLQRADAQPRWSCTEAFALLDQLLSPVNDFHFTLSGRTITPEGHTAHHHSRKVERWSAWFAEGLLRETESGWVFGPADEAWAEPPPPLPAPALAELGRAYRFPSRTADGAPAWLVGRFHTGTGAPAPIPGATDALALHPARGGQEAADRPAQALRTEAGVPVLSVTTMQSSRLQGLTETARSFSGPDLGVLDLRGNSGGSDQPAVRWVSALHRGSLDWAPGANLLPGPTPRATRWTAWARDTVEGTASRAHTARLYVVTDPLVASSGETFVQLARQLPGAVHVGLNTAGCSEYGNVREQAPLPHTGFRARFGHTRFVWSEVQAVTEGRGIFPELWLDVDDPVDFVLRLPR